MLPRLWMKETYGIIYYPIFFRQPKEKCKNFLFLPTRKEISINKNLPFYPRGGKIFMDKIDGSCTKF